MNLLNLMRVLLAIVDEGSMAAAARALRRSPPAVTRDLALLEAHLGCPLLTRSARRVRPTPEGLRFAADARRILADVAEAEAMASGAAGRVAGPVAVTAPATFGRLHVGRLLMDLACRHEALQLRTIFTDRILDIVEEGIDIAVRIGRLPDSSLRAVRVGTQHLLRCAAPGVDAARLPPVRMTGRGDGTLAPLTGERFAVDTIDMALLAAERGLGTAVLLAYQALDALEAGRLRIVPGAPVREVPIHLVHKSSEPMPNRIRATLDHLRTELQQELHRQEAILHAHHPRG